MPNERISVIVELCNLMCSTLKRQLACIAIIVAASSATAVSTISSLRPHNYSVVLFSACVFLAICD